MKRISVMLNVLRIPQLLVTTSSQSDSVYLWKVIPTSSLTKKLNHTECVMYRTVSNDYT